MNYYKFLIMLMKCISLHLYIILLENFVSFKKFLLNMLKVNKNEKKTKIIIKKL